MPNESRATTAPWLGDDTTVTESTEATLQRVQQAETAADAFDSLTPTRKSALPQLLAKSTARAPAEEIVVDDSDLIIDIDEA